MRRFLALLIIMTCVLLANAELWAEVPPLINYQAQLTDSTGAPVDTTVSLTFTIFEGSDGVVSLWSESHPSAVISNGMLSVLLGSVNPIHPTVFDGSTKWLGIQMGSDALDSLIPIVSVAYAMRASKADTAAYASSSATSGSLWNVSDTVVYTNNYWGVARGGAGNTLYGDSLNTMVNLGVGSRTGTDGFDRFYSTVGGGVGNKAGHNYGTVGGGYGNNASGEFATIAGGRASVASGDKSAVGGGNGNTASGVTSVVTGGGANQATGNESAVVGGWDNRANGWRSFTGSGSWNRADGDGSFIGGGQNNYVSSTLGAICGGNRDSVNASYSFIGGGDKNTVSDSYSLIGGGSLNRVEGRFSAILGGRADTIFATADYSYLFGIGSRLTADSTFMVDMPHIRFGDESTGYEFPTSDGSTGQALVTDGVGQLAWTNPPGGGGLTLPYSGTTSVGGEAFSVQNTGGGPAIKGQYHTGPAAGPYNTGWLGNDSCGVYASSANTFDNNYAVYGKHFIGDNLGYLGGYKHGVFGRHSTGNYGYLGSDSAGVFGAGSGGNYACYFDGTSYFDDNVGIGTKSPQDKLHVYGASGAFARVDGGTGISGYRIYEGGAARWILFFRQWQSDNLIIRDEVGTGRDVMTFESNTGRVGIGISTPQRTLDVAGTVQCDVVELTGGGDVAEPFSVQMHEYAEPGMVLSICADAPGELEISSAAYDRKVAGVVSGAGNLNPGIILNKSAQDKGRRPVALTGQVYCWADASHGPVHVGDLLTTSDTPGHAMKVDDMSRAQGAILGKAMTGLESGRGLVLVLVTLQ